MAARLQSAMEYLMTYGWAILAIAIVMVSLYSLGIFNAGNLQPTATPGSCKIVRTTAQTSLAGQCNNLIPKYVGKFNGQSSTVALPASAMVSGNQMTFAVWAERLGNGNSAPRGFMISQGNTYIDTCYSGHPLGQIYTGSYGAAYGVGECSTAGQWVQYVLIYDGTQAILYVNGVAGSAGAVSGNLYQSSPSIGSYGGGNYFFNGTEANIQIYNVSLDNATVKALYQEGIGGAPIDVNHLVGWWPLNGNSNDYSGNNNQGTPTNVVWNANWQNGYSSPST